MSDETEQRLPYRDPTGDRAVRNLMRRKPTRLQALAEYRRRADQEAWRLRDRLHRLADAGLESSPAMVAVSERLELVKELLDQLERRLLAARRKRP